MSGQGQLCYSAYGSLHRQMRKAYFNKSMIKKRMMTKSVQTITVLAAALLLGATAASALEIKSGSDKVQLQLSGEINRAVMYADDGHQDKFFHVDNSNSESRIGLAGEVSASDCLTVGSNIELKWQDNPSHAVSMQEESIGGEFVQELVELYFDRNNFGKLSVGFGGMASDGSSEVDLSGTDLIGNAGVADVGGGLFFYDASTGSYNNEEEGGTTVSDVFKRHCCDLFNRITADGLGKRNRLRYDTPEFAGFSIAVAAGEQDSYDVALNYSGEFNGWQMEAMAAWMQPGGSADQDCGHGDYTQMNASVSVLFDFGLNLTAGYGHREVDTLPLNGEDPEFVYGKIGYKFGQLFSVGSTAVSVDYGVYKNSDNQIIDEDGTATGIQLVQELSDYSTDLFAGYRLFSLEDNTGADYEDISVIMAGARFSF